MISRSHGRPGVYLSLRQRGYSQEDKLTFSRALVAHLPRPRVPARAPKPQDVVAFQHGADRDSMAAERVRQDVDALAGKVALDVLRDFLLAQSLLPLTSPGRHLDLRRWARDIDNGDRYVRKRIPRDHQKMEKTTKDVNEFLRGLDGRVGRPCARSLPTGFSSVWPSRRAT